MRSFRCPALASKISPFGRGLLPGCSGAYPADLAPARSPSLQGHPPVVLPPDVQAIVTPRFMDQNTPLEVEALAKFGAPGSGIEEMVGVKVSPPSVVSARRRIRSVSTPNQIAQTTETVRKTLSTFQSILIAPLTGRAL